MDKSHWWCRNRRGRVPFFFLVWRQSFQNVSLLISQNLPSVLMSATLCLSRLLSSGFQPFHAIGTNSLMQLSIVPHPSILTSLPNLKYVSVIIISLFTTFSLQPLGLPSPPASSYTLGRTTSQIKSSSSVHSQLIDEAEGDGEKQSQWLVSIRWGFTNLALCRRPVVLPGSHELQVPSLFSVSFTSSLRPNSPTGLLYLCFTKKTSNQREFAPSHHTWSLLVSAATSHALWLACFYRGPVPHLIP